MIDTGASVNVVTSRLYSRVKNSVKLEHTNTKLYRYQSDMPIPLRGKFKGNIKFRGKDYTAWFYVTRDEEGSSLLGYETALELNIVNIVNCLEQNQYFNKHPKLFEGLGKHIDKKISLHIDESVKPVAQPHRRIPFNFREAVERKLVELEEADIIEKVDGPTPWVSPIVIVPKSSDPSDVRICVDMREANKAIQRERHITPTIDDIITDLNGAKIFSKLDLNQGYH